MLLQYFQVCKYFFSSSSDPGYVTREWADHYGRGIPVLPVSSRNSYQINMLSICDRCNVIRPERAHHCSTCGYCIEKLDHHCPWYGNCIGRRNIKCFIVSLLANACFGIFVGSYTAYNMYKGIDVGKCFFFAPLGLSVGLACLGMLSITISYIWHNSSFLDRNRSGDNPYDRKSFYANFEESFGPLGWNWLSPFPLPESFWNHQDEQRHNDIVYSMI